MSSFKISIVIFVVLLLLAFVTAPTSVSAQCVSAPSGMTNWWPADGNAFDIVGGEHGTLQGDAGFDTGKVAEAFSLDGDGDYVEVANNPDAAFNFDGSFNRRVDLFRVRADRIRSDRF